MEPIRGHCPIANSCNLTAVIGERQTKNQSDSIILLLISNRAAAFEMTQPIISSWHSGLEVLPLLTVIWHLSISKLWKRKHMFWGSYFNYIQQNNIFLKKFKDDFLYQVSRSASRVTKFKEYHKFVSWLSRDFRDLSKPSIANHNRRTDINKKIEIFTSV